MRIDRELAGNLLAFFLGTGVKSVCETSRAVASPTSTAVAATATAATATWLGPVAGFVGVTAGLVSDIAVERTADWLGKRKESKEALGDLLANEHLARVQATVVAARLRKVAVDGTFWHDERSRRTVRELADRIVP